MKGKAYPKNVPNINDLPNPRYYRQIVQKSSDQVIVRGWKPITSEKEASEGKISLTSAVWSVLLPELTEIDTLTVRCPDGISRTVENGQIAEVVNLILDVTGFDNLPHGDFPRARLIEDVSFRIRTKAFFKRMIEVMNHDE